MSFELPQEAVATGAKDNGWLVHVSIVLNQIITWSTEVPAALLVVAEFFLLLTNVTYRYVLRDPLTWGDELASLLFVWLSMLGCVIALRRGEHMRLTTITAKLSPRARQRTEALANTLVVLFMALLIIPAWEYTVDEWAIITPALQIPHAFRVGALTYGFTLMFAAALSRLMSSASLENVAVCGLVVLGISAALYLFQVQLVDIGSSNLLVFFVVGVTIIVLVGAPIMTAFGLSTLAYLLTVTDIPITVAVNRIDEGMSGLILLSIPMFVFLGALIESMGLAEAMIGFLASLIGHLRGGLSYVLIGAMYLVSGISGSKAADMAAIAPALFPDMKRRGENEGELVAMLSSAGAMSETIPPSLVLITIGSVTNVSIAALFTGGFMPAVAGALAMAVVVWIKNRNKSVQHLQRASSKEIWSAFRLALPSIVLPFLIRAAVVNGVATATEVATIGIAYTFAVGMIFYRKFEWKTLQPMLVNTASLSGAILLIIGCATSMAWALTQSGFSSQLAVWMSVVPGGAIGFMMVSAIAFMILGSFLEGIPAIVLFGPLLFPLARNAGINEVHYAMVAVFAMGLGLFAPPFGVGFYAACAIGKVRPEAAVKNVWAYLAALFIALLAIAAIPWISTGFL
jgi:tripartite ATP-independent transporter DctM subunit